jgi:hypothetical protein
MSGAIGPDIAAVYQLLTQVARTLTGHGRKLDDRSTGCAKLSPRTTASSMTLPPASLSKLDERVRRIERHLRIEPAGN